MSKYGEPLRRRDASIVRSDGTTVVKGTSRRDPRCTKCQCSASTFVHVESADRIVACVNACAGIENPGALPALLARIGHALADDPNGRLAGIRGAFDVMMGDRT